MRQFLSSTWICAFGILAIGVGAQTASNMVQQVDPGNGKNELVPTKVVEFKTVEMEPDFALPATSVDYPHCLSDGSLVVHTVDWAAATKTPKGKFPKYNETVTIVRGKKMLTISSTSISDLTEFNNGFDIFPSDSGIYFLVQGSKEQPGSSRGPGKSPMGIPLKDFHNYVAKFDLDGTYKGTTEIGTQCDLSRPGSCELRHLAVFPSGDMLVSESDPATSTLKVLYLKSSGEVVKQIEVPASRRPMEWGDDASSNPELEREAKAFLASVFFTAVGENIVVWRANSADPAVEVHDGGGVREVPIEIPQGWRFADLIASNDRWVAHFRTENTPPNVRMSPDVDAYYEVRPQDGSLAVKIAQKGEAPLAIACESSGMYTSFKMNEAGKMVLLTGQ
jgi:hypothetical protein